MSGTPREVELKLRLPASSAAKVLAHDAVRERKCGRTRTTRLVGVYFDTPDRRLAGEGIALRLRRAGKTWLQTIKGPASKRAGGLSERVECEWRVGRSTRRPPLDLARLATTPYRDAIAKAVRRGGLGPVFVTRFARTMVPLRFDDGTIAQLCVDRGIVHAGERAAPGVARETISEIELEIASGNAVRLFDLALALAGDVPLAIEPRSKAARGDALGRDSRPGVAVARAEPVTLDRDATAGEAMASVVRNCLRQVEGNADGVRRGEDPESVHQMRVGLRRLRSSLALLRGAIPQEQLQPLQDELRSLAALLGGVRDLDVFTTDTLPSIASATRPVQVGVDTIEAPIAKLETRAAARLQVARREADAAMTSAHLTRLMLRVARLALEVETTPGAGEALQRPARDFAAGHLQRRHRKLLRHGRALTGTAAERHELRIAAKKLRYACEFFAPLFPAKALKAYRDALAKLQKALGRANDAAVAIAIAAELAPASPSAALVAGWAGARAAGSDARLERAWRSLARATPFWKA